MRTEVRATAGAVCGGTLGRRWLEQRALDLLVALDSGLKSALHEALLGVYSAAAGAGGQGGGFQEDL